MGKRGPKASPLSRHARMELRLSFSELGQLRDSAREHNTSLAAYVRQAALEWRGLKDQQHLCGLCGHGTGQRLFVCKPCRDTAIAAQLSFDVVATLCNGG